MKYAILGIVFTGLGMICRTVGAQTPLSPTSDTPIPVILDTDIGDDMDDAWALVMLLKSPRFDVRLITTTNGKTDYRVDLIAKYLTLAGRTDIPIGRGVGKANGDGGEVKWLQKNDRGSYAGKVLPDGVGGIVDVVNRSSSPVTIIGIGPLQTLAAALERDPGIASKANLVGMQGSVRIGYEAANKPAPEYNVATDPAAAKRVFAAHWHSMAITPLDTCGLPGVMMDGSAYEACRKSNDPLLKELIDSYVIWHAAGQKNKQTDPKESSRLFDTVAIYLADPDHCPLLKLERLNISVTHDGKTIIDPKGQPMEVATGWTDLAAYREDLVKVLLSPTTAATGH